MGFVGFFLCEIGFCIVCIIGMFSVYPVVGAVFGSLILVFMAAIGCKFDALCLLRI